MTARPADPATDKTASKLLPPRRRRQIEIWLDETVHYESLQNCAADKGIGHASDLPVSTGGPHSSTSSFSTSTQCPVCFRYFRGQEPQIGALDAPGPPAASGSKADKPRSVSVFRGLKAAMTSLKPKDASERYDPALSTKMFVVPAEGGDEAGSNRSSSAAGLGSSDDGDAGKRLLDERMARLKRAQKLLEKGPVQDKG